MKMKQLLLFCLTLLITSKVSVAMTIKQESDSLLSNQDQQILHMVDDELNKLRQILKDKIDFCSNEEDKGDVKKMIVPFLKFWTESAGLEYLTSRKSNSQLSSALKKLFTDFGNDFQVTFTQTR